MLKLQVLDKSGNLRSIYGVCSIVFFSKMGLDKVFMKADQNPVGVRITSLFFFFFYRNKKVDNCPKKIHGAVLEQ